MQATYWLSFTDPDRPLGSQAIGVSITMMLEEVEEYERETTVPTHQELSGPGEPHP